MNAARFLIFHKDHPLHTEGVNSGAENATLWLARALHARGHEVFVAGTIVEGSSVKWGINFIDIGVNFQTKIAFDIINAKGHYHLISACRAFPILEAQNDSLCLSTGFIAHDPSSGAAGIKPSILSNICDHVICVSEAQKKLFVDAGGIDSKIHVIANGADLDLFKATPTEKRNLKRFVFVGALVPHKGIDILIHAFAKALSKVPDAELHIYGSSKLWGEESFIDEKDISRQVPQIKFFGAVGQNEIASAFGSAGACIIPSRWFDSFPLTAVEALVTGCPVIAFDVGGIKEAVSHKINGEIISEVSEQALNSTIERLLSSPETLMRYSNHALNNARNIFTWENTALKVESLCSKAILTKGLQETKVGLITPWNQECGLATYGKFLASSFPTNSYFIFAENEVEVTASDEEFVTRCWNRNQNTYQDLKNAVEESGVKLLHLNCHARFFSYPEFGDFTKWAKSKGIKLVASIHNLFTIDKYNQNLLADLDFLYVHATENVIEAVANGIDINKVAVVPHGVHKRESLTLIEIQKIKSKYGISSDEKLITSFGFIQPHKGIEALLESVIYLKSKGIAVKALICGKPHDEDPNAKEYSIALKDLAKQHNISKEIIFLDRFATEEEVSECIGASDVVVMNYKSQHFEASGACSIAVGAGAAVVTSLAPPFMSFGDSVFHATSGYPVSFAVEQILTNFALRETLKRNALAYSKQNSWEQIGQLIQANYLKLGLILDTQKIQFKYESTKVSKQELIMIGNSNSNKRKIKVLLNNRPTTFTHRGGDTVVIEKLLEGLSLHNVDVTIDLEGKVDPKGFDIVHIFNFALPDMVKFYAERAKNAGVPYVVTSLLEDVPSFHYQSHYVASVVMEYVSRGQDANWWRANTPNYHAIESAEPFDNSWVAKNAAVIFPNGASEADTIKRTYGADCKTEIIQLGYELKTVGSRVDCVKEFGIENFILCVGRIESRKNQLMLLKALENDEVTLVFADGGFSYQPEYDQAVRNFKRKGKTIFLGRLSDQQLANIYAAAKVHVLPSWYELPGLVSLEAAFHGCNVVATRYGTSTDYLGEHAFYCDPGNADSIRTAVLSAYYAPIQTGLKEKVMNYSWKEMADRTLKSYQKVSGISTDQLIPAPIKNDAKALRASTAATSNLAEDPVLFHEYLEKGELLAKQGKYDQAIASFDKALSCGAPTARLYRAKGATLLADNKPSEAKPFFENAILIDGFDAKSYCGKGMCANILGDKEEAYQAYVKSLDISPSNSVSIYQLLEVSYILNKYDDLERVLRTYLVTNPDDVEMQFCLAGCLYKAGRISEARAENNKVINSNPKHEGGLELQQLLSQTNSERQIEVERIPQSKSDLSSVSAKFCSVDEGILDAEEKKRRKEFVEALDKINSLLSEPAVSDSQWENLSCLKSEILVLTDNFINAETLYDEVLLKNSSCSRALCGKGALAAARSNWNTAQGYFERALANRVEYDVALSGLGLCAATAGSHEAAWVFYERSLRSNPENMRALLGIIEMGYALKRLEPVEKAIKHYLDSHPADINVMYSLAGCCFAQGKLNEAIEAVNTITLFEPEHKNALELRAMIDSELRSQTNA